MLVGQPKKISASHQFMENKVIDSSKQVSTMKIKLNEDFRKSCFNKYVKIEKTSQISLLKCTNATTKVYKLLSNMNIEEK